MPLDDAYVVAGKPLHGPNLWPPDPAFRTSMETYFRAVTAMGRSLLPSFARALALEDDYFLRLYERPLANMRIMRYPPLPETRAPDQFSTAPHTDYGMITLLAQDATGGLEVRLQSGEWVGVPCVEGAFVVNLGDMLACWTNDRFTSTPHRVLNRSGGDRYSIPLFYNPNFDTTVTCLPGCGDASHPPRYPPMRCGDYILGKYERVFAGSYEAGR